ncbi:MAG TPA: AsmA-like C-terminal region-containing protein [Dongiaceae bacterium]|jgi:uncharacterized protein involved in outer membrane biogenesis|nr:AsmA-like C-terminal region-containing protein [Dongiaceae bacterium]
MPKQGSRFSRIVHGAAFALGALLVLLLVAGGAGALWLSRADLRPIVERAASGSLGRQVTLGSLKVRWGDPLRIEFTDLAIANAPWGSEPQMVRVGHAAALLDVAPLLSGVLRYERLRISDATIVLERDPHGIGNWKFGGGSGLVLVPKDRTQFPTLIDFAGEHGLITYRTHGGDILRIALDRVAISSPSEETPARLLAEGAYNNVATRLDATTDSYETLRDASQPFGTRFTLAGRDTDIAFDGTLREPLDFEGARGEVSVDARTLNDILGVMGAKAKSDLPLSVGGILKHDGDRWLLAAAKGELMQSDFTGGLALLEGQAGKPDDITLDLTAGALDLDAIMASFGGPAKAESVALHPEGLAAINVTAALTTARLTVAARNLRSVTLLGRLAAGDVTLKELSFALGGGTLSLSGALQGTSQNGELALDGRLSKADAGGIAQELGATGDEINGQLDGAARLALHGPTLAAAMKTGSGAAIVLLRQGQIARSLIEQLSTDLRSLLRTKEGRVPVSCLLGVLNLKDGIGILSPLRLESRDAIVVGAGKFDIGNKKLDVTLKTERDSTNFFALDIPVRISGPLENVSAKPLVGSDANWLERPAAADRLPADLRQMANSSTCRD